LKWPLSRDARAGQEYRAALARAEEQYQALSDEARQAKVKEVEDRVAQLAARLADSGGA
jgi:hypothetical protein